MRVAERLQVTQIGQVRAFLNTHVYGGDPEPRNEDLCALAEQLDQRQRVLATTQSNKDMVAVLDERIVRTRLVKPLGQAVLQTRKLYLFGRTHHFAV